MAKRNHNAQHKQEAPASVVVFFFVIALVFAFAKAAPGLARHIA
ncbi:hypothetical protein [Paraburkholderia sp. DGU8]